MVSIEADLGDVVKPVLFWAKLDEDARRARSGRNSRRMSGTAANIRELGQTEAPRERAKATYQQKKNVKVRGRHWPGSASQEG